MVSSDSSALSEKTAPFSIRSIKPVSDSTQALHPRHMLLSPLPFVAQSPYEGGGSECELSPHRKPWINSRGLNSLHNTAVRRVVPMMTAEAMGGRPRRCPTVFPVLITVLLTLCLRGQAEQCPGRIAVLNGDAQVWVCCSLIDRRFG
ncbi:Hypp325 [Branchiostoma lanceolatum]|uniref:Hypp325 protein n=1 Tax=Branchiostoma lanceolatum TaxID=7740 RepID=A0A8J9VCL4_BRALA|nr:Hypp325 [Branchiostoma lanceolatum]